MADYHYSEVEQDVLLSATHEAQQLCDQLDELIKFFVADGDYVESGFYVTRELINKAWATVHRKRSG